MKKIDYSKLTIPQLTAAFDSTLREYNTRVLDSGPYLLALCDMLVEFERKKLTHVAMTQGIFRRFREISSGKLSAYAAQMLTGDDFTLDRLFGMPLSTQDSIAKGDKLAVVFFDKRKNETAVAEKPIENLSKKEKAQVLKLGHLATPAEQRKEVMKEVKQVSSVPVRPAPSLVLGVSLKTGQLIVGTEYVKPELLVPHLDRLGIYMAYKGTNKRVS